MRHSFPLHHYMLHQLHEELYELGTDHSLAHDHNRFVSSTHLHLLYQVGNLQYGRSSVRYSILLPLQELELSYAESSGCNRLASLIFFNLQFSQNKVIENFLVWHRNNYFTIFFRAAFDFRPVAMTNHLYRQQKRLYFTFNCRYFVQ